MIIMKLYLQHKLRPIKIAFESEERVKQFIDSVKYDTAVDLKQFIFNSKLFRYSIVEIVENKKVTFKKKHGSK